MAGKKVGKKKSKLSLHLTGRALEDINAIAAWSVENFGQKIADEYIGKFEAALTRILENPKLLRSQPKFHPTLQFYRMERHLLVCETAIEQRIIVLTVVHESMDILSRLAEWEPTLQAEVVILLEKLKQA